MPNVPFGIPEYGITNVTNLGEGFPCQQPPKGAKGGHLFMEMSPRLKTM